MTKLLFVYRIMNILLLSNGYPSKEQPFGSIYVKNHYNRLREVYNINVDKHVIARKNTNYFGSFLKYIWCFISFLGKIPKKYDVIHVHFLSPVYVLACLYKLRRPSCKIVITFHGSDINKLSNEFLINLYRLLFRFNDTIISVSQNLKLKSENMFDFKVDYVLSAGFNDNIFFGKGSPYGKREIDFLFVGSFLPIKGLDTLIDAIKLLNNKDIRFVFVGTGKLRTELCLLKKQYNVVVIDGLPQYKLNDIYNNTKYFILPSYNEGFNIALLEANYCGVPAIVRDIPALRNQVISGKNGFLFNNTEDLASLINACKSIDHDEWKKQSEISNEYAQGYSLSRVIDTLLDIYRK